MARFIFLLGSLLISFFSLKGQQIPSSVATTHLNAIATALTDTSRINRILDYSKDLLKYNVDSALVMNEAITKQSKALAFKYGTVTSLINQAKIWRIKGDIFTSFSKLNEALYYCNHNDHSYLYLIYANRAINNIIQADYKTAITNYYKAAKIAETSKDTSIKLTRLYLNLSLAWKTMGNKKREIYYLQMAEKQVIIEKDSVSLSNVYYRRGSYSLQRGDTLKALDYYFESLSVGRLCDDKDIEAKAIESIIYVYIMQGKEKKAMQYLSQFDTLSKNKEVELYHRLGMLYFYGLYSFLLKDYHKAEEEWKQAVLKADSLNANIYKLNPLAGLHTLYATTKRFKKAYYYQQMYADLKNHISNDKSLKVVNLLEHKYQLAKKDKILAQQKMLAGKQQAIVEKRNTFIIFSIISCIAVTFLLIALKSGYKRNRQLQLEQLRLLQREQILRQFKATISGAESERKRIAQELHDGVGSLLSVAKMDLSIIQERTCNSTNENVDFLETVHLLDVVSADLRSTAHNLIPEFLLRGGLEEALQVSCEKIGIARQVDINFQSYGDAPIIEAELELSFYRILRELLYQTLTYTKSSSILLQLNWQSKNLCITIDTNGLPILTESFDEHQIQKWEQLALYIRGMNGRVEIDNAASSSGSTVELEFSLD